MRSLLLLVAFAAGAQCMAQNIVRNPDVELGGKSSAIGWSNHVAEGAYEFFIAGDAHSGRRCLAIRAVRGPGWARWYTTDLYLLKGATYRVSAWVKAGEGGIAEVWLPSDNAGFHKQIKGPVEWSHVQTDFTVSRTGRHGLYLQSRGTGTVCFDDVKVWLTKPAPVAPGEPVPTDEEPVCGIVVPQSASAHHVYLAGEVQRILKAMTGKAPDIRIAEALPSGTGGRRIWIGVPPPGRNYAPQLAIAGEEGIVLDIGAEAIVCLGSSPRGVYYAVHELLHVLGCRWCWPGPLGEVIPKTDRLTIRPQLIVHRPSFDLRGCHIIQVYHTPPDWKPKHVNADEWVDWAARNRMNRLKPSYPKMWDYGAVRGGHWEEFAGHTLYTVLPPDKWFDKRPDFYPLVSGKRTARHSSGRAAEVCVANPDVQKAVADYIIEYFDSHPGAKRFGINAEDEPSYWCECDACKALDTEDLDWADNGVKCMHLTDRWIYFVNKVAELVEKKHPDKTIFTFAYGSTRELPRRHLPRHNVMIELTWWDRCFKHAVTDPACEVNAQGMKRFRDWSRLAGLSLYRYLDYHHMESPCPYYRAEADILRTVHAAGCRHLSDEWDTTFTSSPLLLNLRARLQWDVNTDVDAFIDDFCSRVYGAAAPAAAAFFRRLERAVAEAPADHVRFNDTEKFTPQMLADCHGLLDRACALADSDEAAARLDRLRYTLLFAELENVSEAAKTNPRLFARQAELQDRIWRLVQKRNIEPILGYYGKLGREYRPPVAALSGRRVLELPQRWMFRTDPGNVGEKQKWFEAAPGGEWKPVSIHEAWETQGYGGYDGYAWYSVEIVIPEIAEKHVWLLCEAVDETFKLWINGHYVGASEGDPGVLWDKPVAVEITGKFKPGAANRITMRVHDIGYAGGIWKPVRITASQ